MQNGVTLIGPVSNDSVRPPGAPERRQPGGAVYYAGMALAALGVPVTIITRLAARDKAAVLQPLQVAGATVTALPSAHTTHFVNIYGPGTDERHQEVSARADAFTIADVPPMTTQWVYLAPLLAGDISTELIKNIAARGRHRIALDVQGLLRQVTNAKVTPAGWPEKYDILPHIDILKADGDEAALITGQNDPEMAARLLCGRGVDHALVTLGSAGAILCHRGAVFHIPACRPAGRDWSAVDTTGCGDTFLAAYLAAIIAGKQAVAAGRFAAAASALKQTAFGPLRADRSEINRLIGEIA